ncbi:hypothetical protein D3C81_1789290 [compost metagenome]
MIGPNEVSNEGRQRIVVTEFQLVQRYGVVLINDRQHVMLKQLFDRHAGVARPLAVLKIRSGQQHLRGGNPVPCQFFTIGLHQQGLTDGG